MNTRYERAQQVLGARKVWELKQRNFYIMRHDGLPRLNKPFPKAADSHFPLIDMQIGALKPFWIAQAFNGERLADFIAMQSQAKEFSEAAADYMDFEVKYRTDFADVNDRAVDTMCLRGRGVYKIVLNPFTLKIECKAVDPQFIIMSEAFDDFQDSDWFTEIQVLTVEQYKRNRNYNQSSDVIAALRGKTADQLEQIRLDKRLREGVTHAANEDLMVLWNTYEQTPSGWNVYTEGPLARDKNILADDRKFRTVNLKWDGETLIPFYSITMETKDAGWYAPRGVAELGAAFEAYCTKLWNEKSDAMTFGNKPLFTSEKDIPNANNIRFVPGEYIPGNLQAVQMPQPAYSFQEEINFTRAVSEQRVKMPDFGIDKQDESGQGSKPRTATENNRIAALQDVGADYNGEMFRRRLMKIYRHIWALIAHRETLVALDPKRMSPMRSLAYLANDQLKMLPTQALHTQYLVIPGGQSGNKQQRIQRGMGLYTTFKGDPGVDQDELKKVAIEPIDARLVRRLVLGSNVKQGKEAENEAMEIGIMILGFPAQAAPDEDHATRIMVDVGYIEKQHVTGAPVDPIALQRIVQHTQQHLQFLQQQQPKVAAQMKQQIAAMLAQHTQPPMQAPQRNGSPMPQPNGAPGEPV